jgi:hypothetical protein
MVAMHPLPNDPAAANRLVVAIGQLILMFGTFETARQSAIVAIHHGADRRESGRGTGSKRLPPDVFSHGSDYMRKSVQFEGMGIFASDIERIMDTADRLAEKRNRIVHGFYMQFDEDSQTAVFQKFNVDKSDDIYAGKSLRLTIDELETLRDEAQALTIDMTNLALRITQLLFGEPELILDFGPTV